VYVCVFVRARVRTCVCARECVHACVRACVRACMRVFARACVHTPNPLSPGIFAVAIALGWSHTCAIVSGGGVKCWGNNGNGQLGIGSTTAATSPADVAGDISIYLSVAGDRLPRTCVILYLHTKAGCLLLLSI
jgi:hypothetical protein